MKRFQFSRPMRAEDSQIDVVRRCTAQKWLKRALDGAILSDHVA